MPRPSNDRTSGGARALRRAESTIAIELAQVSPFTVSGISRAVHPVGHANRRSGMPHRNESD